MVKYKYVPLKSLFKSYSKTLIWILNTLLQSLLYSIAQKQVTLFFMAFGLGMMLSDYMCERLHSNEWIRRHIDDEFNKALLLIEAEKIKNGD